MIYTLEEKKSIYIFTVVVQKRKEEEIELWNC